MAKQPRPQNVSAAQVFQGFQEDKRPHGRRIAIIAAIMTTLLLAYGGLAYAVSGKVPQGTSVAGIDLSGMTSAQATNALKNGLKDRDGHPFDVAVEGKAASLDPKKAGIAIDYKATISSLTRFSLNPVRIAQTFMGLGEKSVISTIEETKLEAALKDLAPSLKTEPVEAGVTCKGEVFEKTEPKNGAELDVKQAVATLEKTWATDKLPLALPGKVTLPQTTAEHLAKAFDEDAKAIMSGPVTVSIEDKTTELSPGQLCVSSTFTPSATGLDLQIDGEKLKGSIEAALPDIEKGPVDATFSFSTYGAAGTPIINPSSPGKTLSAEDVAKTVTAAALSTENRIAGLTMTEKEPEFTTEKANAAGIKEIISEFSTPLPYNPVRTQNLIMGTNKITGVVIAPGKNFSLLGAIGPVDAAHGWTTSDVVENGFHRKAAGGGLSQLSTTTYNAGFFGGMDDVEHTPHSEYFSRYPAGREATLWDPRIDMKFGNSTPYHVLVQGWVADARVHVRLWSTKHYEVKESSSERWGYVAPKTRHSLDPKCEPSAAGTPGFSIKIRRERWLNGSMHDNQEWVHSYVAQDNVVCGPKPDPNAPPPAQPTD